MGFFLQSADCLMVASIALCRGDRGVHESEGLSIQACYLEKAAQCGVNDKHICGNNTNSFTDIQEKFGKFKPAYNLKPLLRRL